MNFLKRSKPKEKQEMKVVSQRKMNAYFIGGAAAFLLLTGTAITTNVLNNTSKTTTQDLSSVTFGKTNVDYRLQQFLDNFVQDYFTYSDDPSEQKGQQEKVESYYDNVPDTQVSAEDKKPSQLVGALLQTIKNNVATYQVVYATGDELSNTITIRFSIPFGEKNGGFYVSGLPWIEAVSDLKASGVNKNEKLSLTATDNLSQSEKKELDDFLELFFTNYTTSQKNLNLISDDIKTVNGVMFEGIDFVYYVKNTSSTIAYVQVKFDIAGNKYSENFTLKLVRKRGDYYVSNLKHTIPVDYAKNTEDSN
ncbi:conjugal transfer protein [Streptococcus sp. zg-JUN1979]|uniref:conjugal transfer protein n=1 Tax=Streptococcus sp. zg-JUN1979 TaxID=3391450 RepID=UPI0039A74CA2